MKYLSLLVLLSGIFATQSSTAQVTSVSIHDSYDQQSNTYTMTLVVNEGEATIPSHRIQLNGQISIVAPAGSTVQIIESIEPLQGNIEPFSGTTPANWKVSNIIDSPEVTPESSYHGITPTLSPTSRYNELTAGQCVDLFTYQIQGCTDDCARLFVEGTDPSAEMPGMNGADLTPGLTIFNLDDIFDGIDENPSCLISSTVDLANAINIYPNPASDQMTVSAAAAIHQVQIITMQGKVISTIPGQGQTDLQLELASITAGTYTIAVHTDSGTTAQLITRL